MALLVVAALPACRETTPTEPETRPVLVVAYTGPCAWGNALVVIDRVPVGRVAIPGALTLPVPAGPHELRAGGGPAVPFTMPADRDLTLTNQPSPCP